MKLTPQDALEYMGTMIIILTGIEPAAKAANLLLPGWVAFTLAVSVMALAALQKQYQRKLEREAQSQPSAEQAHLLSRQNELIQRQREALERFMTQEPPSSDTQPAAIYGAGEGEG